ncbi:MAG TPA: GTPase ObgE [Spirochaetota bacterium]|nr:GTPase ObgE [Spirochaetota bacterium]HOL56182.1 GTPase ObgE [Spirochaetota bacterium]HPP03786.1 GTPase ObgE [Spirochaetota bacterium]
MQHFVDEVVIKVASGKGGAGCASFRREKFIPYGGPDGGDGGDGGNVVFRVKDNLRTLYNLYLKKEFKAKNGHPGMSQQKNGKKGEDVIIEIPPGTVISYFETGEIIKDFKKNDPDFIFLKGGKGGRGNVHFKSSTNQAPRYAQPGLPGQEAIIKVELKLIADVGLVGFPNAGKSTLLSVVSSAKPKIANYPFTTLIPNLGVFIVDDESFVMADIPGIIEGASHGAGLGLEFLKHIERTKILLFLINLEDDDYLHQYEKLRKELKEYSEKLLEKPYIIVASKMDIEDAEKKLKELEKSINQKVLPISSVTRFNIDKLLYLLKDEIHKIENVK